jgi:chemotaxis-related protein WspD
MIFRLGNEWLAVPVQLLQEITQACVIQKLPHRSNELFMGLVNIRGEILLCVSLNHLLNLELMVEGTAAKVPTSKRMMVIADGENRWVFPVDEVCGVYRFQLDELEKTPVVISKASAAYTQGVINWQGQKVNYLDFDLLFYTLSRRIL